MTSIKMAERISMLEQKVDSNQEILVTKLDAVKEAVENRFKYQDTVDRQQNKRLDYLESSSSIYVTKEELNKHHKESNRLQWLILSILLTIILGFIVNKVLGLL